MSTITTDRVAYHDIAIVTVPNDHAFVSNKQHLTCLKMSFSYWLRSNANLLPTEWFTVTLFSSFLRMIVTDALKVLFS